MKTIITLPIFGFGVTKEYYPDAIGDQLAGRLFNTSIDYLHSIGQIQEDNYEDFLDNHEINILGTYQNIVSSFVSILEQLLINVDGTEDLGISKFEYNNYIHSNGSVSINIEYDLTKTINYIKMNKEDFKEYMYNFSSSNYKMDDEDIDTYLANITATEIKQIGMFYLYQKYKFNYKNLIIKIFVIMGSNLKNYIEYT